MTGIASLHKAAQDLWQRYLELGPGRLPDDAMEPYLNERAALKTDVVEVHALLAELEPLLRRCVERTEGLCFVTGEAGLIPRRDLHAKCEELLDQLERLSSAQ